MLEGQKLGPILVEKEIGAGAMGTVYRGTLETTGQRVAIKMISPAIATNESSLARFEREANILKQLKHPNIVRLFGIGKHKKMRYYAMEYIKGESLDELLSRQGKLSWDEVINLGTQLCAALQHAHDKGVVHRDLKPSNLMILEDGTLKLTDFGIAKDLDVTQLTEANCTVGTAAYMSPEQCKGDRDLTSKSDLYSLGVVFFELITGRKPFYAETAMEMFLCHVEKKPDRPIQHALDLPIWMDNLVVQLMEKKPEHRPMNAQIVKDALEEVRDKVETQQSAGVEAAGKRRIDRVGNDPKIDEKDKEAARALRGGKKKKRKKKGKPFYATVWFQAIGIIAILGTLATVLYFAFQPRDPEVIFAEAKALMESKNPDDWFKAQSGPIEEYLASYRAREGEQTQQIFTWNDWISMYEADRKVDNYGVKRRDKNITLSGMNEAETVAFKAGWAEANRDFDEATKHWTETKEKYGKAPYSRWGALAKLRLSLYDRIAKQDEVWKKTLTSMYVKKAEPKLTKFPDLAFRAYRAKTIFEDKAWARELYIDLRKAVEEQLASNPNSRYWLLLALWNIEDSKSAKSIDQKEMLGALLDKLESQPDPMMCLHIMAVYKEARKFEPEVERAKELMNKTG